MATKLKSFDFGPQSRLTNGDKQVYPWEDWFDGDIWKIRQDEDFPGNPLMLERIIRTRAVSRGAKVTLRHLPDDDGAWAIVLQRTDIEGPETAKRRQTSEKRAASRAAKKPSTADVEAVQSKRKPAVKQAPALKKVSKKAPRKLAAVK